MWPTIARTSAGGRAILDATKNLPNVSVIVAQNRDLIRKLEMAHLETLLSRELGRDYIESCRKTVAHEAAIGLDARYRSTAGNFVLRAAMDALARKYRFSPSKLAESVKLISQVIAFDVANAMTLHREAA